MPYRQASPPGPGCVLHAMTPASLECARCQLPVCHECAHEQIDGVLCPRCATRRRRLASLGRWAVVAALLAVISTGAIVLMGGTVREGADSLEQQIPGLVSYLATSPCDSAALDELVTAAGRARQSLRALGPCQRYLEGCSATSLPLHEELAALAADHHWQEAADLAQALVKLLPDDFTGWKSLGRSLEHLARPTEAIAAYHRALDFEHGDEVLNLSLAALERRHGRPCEALAVLDLHAPPHSDPTVQSELAALHDDLRCRGWEDCRRLCHRVRHLWAQ